MTTVPSDNAWTTLPSHRLVHLEPTQIIFEDRARQSYEGLGELAESIREKGVIQTLAVQETENPEQFKLLAGGRRYSAALLARLRPLPCLVFPRSLSSLDQKEIELFENLHRKDLVWQETDKLRREIHELMVKKHGAPIANTGLGHSQTSTARLLNIDRSRVSASLRRADALDKHPELAQAKTASDADKLLKKIERERETAAAVKRFEGSKESANLAGELAAKQQLARQYMIGDFFQLIKDIPGYSANLIELDPPYALELQEIKSTHERPWVNLDGYTEVGKDEYLAFMKLCFKECYRVLYDHGWLICWHAFQWHQPLKDLLLETGFQVGNVPGFWIKPGGVGQTLQPNYNLGSAVEPFFYARKSESLIFRPGRNNHFDYAPVRPEKKIHPTERPIELIQDILTTFTSPNSSVIVPFLGSGNSLLAASNAQMRAFGFDLDEGGAYRPGFVLRVEQGESGKFTSYA